MKNELLNNNNFQFDSINEKEKKKEGFFIIKYNKINIE